MEHNEKSPVIAAGGLEVQRLTWRITFSSGGFISQNWGSTLRGGFGHALRDVSCSLRRPDCRDCALGTGCAYGWWFETPVDATAEVMRKYTHAPHPFVFEPPQPAPPAVAANDQAEFSLVIIGKALSYVPFVALALEELGKRGIGKERARFTVKSAHTEAGAPVFEIGERKKLHRVDPLTLPLNPGASREAVFTIHLVSPMRLQVGGTVAKKPTPAEIAENLMRRLFLLRYFHCDGEKAPLDKRFKDAAQALETATSSLRWRDDSRHSGRQHRDVPIGGVTGFIRCRGNFGVLESLLRAGEYVHVGKNATFGLGRIRVTEGETEE